MSGNSTNEQNTNDVRDVRHAAATDTYRSHRVWSRSTSGRLIGQSDDAFTRMYASDVCVRCGNASAASTVLQMFDGARMTRWTANTSISASPTDLEQSMRADTSSFVRLHPTCRVAVSRVAVAAAAVNSSSSACAVDERWSATRVAALHAATRTKERERERGRERKRRIV